MIRKLLNFSKYTLPIMLIAIVLMGSGCEKNKDECLCPCGVEEPQENLEWLVQLLDKRFCTEVYLYTHNNKEYIGIHDCPEVHDGGWVIYNCDGTKFCKFIGINAQCDCPPDFLKNAKKTLIYKQE